MDAVKALKFLIAHENPVFRRILKRYLEYRGFTAILAGSAVEAETISRLEQPDIVVAPEKMAIHGKLRLDGLVPPGAGSPLTILLSEAGPETADTPAAGRVLRLSRPEFMELLRIGPALFAILAGIVQQ